MSKPTTEEELKAYLVTTAKVFGHELSDIKTDSYDYSPTPDVTGKCEACEWRFSAKLRWDFGWQRCGEKILKP